MSKSICGECGDQKSSITIWMPPHWVASRDPRCFSVDACIASEIMKLMHHGIRTMNCCCGHGTDDGIVLVEENEKTRYTMEQLGYGIKNELTPCGDTQYIIPKDRIKHIGPKEKE